MSEGYVIEHLSKSELTRLKKMVLGYGKFKKTAEAVDMPEITFRSILSKGYGRPENVEKIRVALLND